MRRWSQFLENIWPRAKSHRSSARVCFQSFSQDTVGTRREGGNEGEKERIKWGKRGEWGRERVERWAQRESTCVKVCGSESEQNNRSCFSKTRAEPEESWENRFLRKQVCTRPGEDSRHFSTNVFAHFSVVKSICQNSWGETGQTWTAPSVKQQALSSKYNNPVLYQSPFIIWNFLTHSPLCNV